MCTIRDKVCKLIQEINSVGSSFPMLYVKSDFIEKMELESDSIPMFKETLESINKLVEKALKSIEDYNTIVQIKNLYSEAYIFSKLRSLVAIKKIQEKKSKTPDYVIRFRGKDIFIELKSLNMLEGTIKHKRIMEESLDSKIAAENQIHNGSKVGFGEQEIQPYLTQNNKEYDPRSVRLVIESLIDKINQNIKTEQYSSGDTVLLVDLSDQLPLISKPLEAIQKRYHEKLGDTFVNGELWNVAFGKLNDEILRPAEFKGANNLDGKLKKEGILISHPYIKGLIFHIDECFYSLAEITRDNMNIINFFQYLSKSHSFKNCQNKEDPADASTSRD